MWNMMQDFLNTCLKANEVLAVNEQMALRKSWVASDDEKDACISVCRVVKRHYYGMEKLLSTLKPPVFLSNSNSKTQISNQKKTINVKEPGNSKTQISNQKQTIKVKEPAFRSGTSLRTYSKCNASNNIEKDAKVARSRNIPSSIKQEPIEIDDSDAFMMVKKEPAESSPSQFYEIEFIDDDAITLKETKLEPVESLDSNVDEGEDYEADSSVSLDRESLNTVCQVCGKTTKDMAIHLASHSEKLTISDEKNVSKNTSKIVDHNEYNTSPRKRLRQSLARTVDGTSTTGKNKLSAGTRLSCEVCGIVLSNILVARIHARSHISDRPFKKEALFESG
ncbi:uncharacterized protein LOC128732535 isoform X2 [Sabethes cyaneus]|nr:uncharacterized protein LOC128732535 isoform X2 [Sabethes cyaneus]